MIVSELAKRCGISAHVVRYYARIGLLTPVRNPDNGYKLFKQGDIARLHFIRQAQSLGFTLEEIQEILQQDESGILPCPMVRQTLTRRIVENRRQIQGLLDKEQRMEQALALWEEMPDQSHHDNSVCYLIEQAAVVDKVA
ncbi:MAG: MerR family transcriptional regulator [Acidiferrobacterales bacterium]